MASGSALCASTFSNWKLHGDASDRESFDPQKQNTTRVHLISSALRQSPIFGSGMSLLRNQVQHLIANDAQLFREPKSMMHSGGCRCLGQLASTQWAIVAGDRWLSRGRRRETGGAGAGWEGTDQRTLWQSNHTSLNSPKKRSAIGVVEVNVSMSFVAHAATTDMGFTAQAGEKEGGEEVGSYLLDERQWDGNDSQKQVPYDWQAEWYPVWISQDFPEGKPVPITIFDKPLVLYRDSAGVVRCVEDKCPHRLAKLSEGQVLNGRLECLYHGWQFEGETGKCVQIPQLAEGAKIPQAACLTTYPVVEKDGYIFVFMTATKNLLQGDKNDNNGSDESSSNTNFLDKALQKLPDFSYPGLNISDSHTDLPYDHSFLIENIMDPAHLHISHHAIPGGGNRAYAGPMEMQIIERSDRGFKGIFPITDRPNLPAKVMVLESQFLAPCHVINLMRYSTEGDGKGAGDLYQAGIFSCVPLGFGRSRLFGRGCLKSDIINRIPRWFVHLNATLVLEQDMGLLASQEAYARALLRDRPLSRLYLALETSDLLLIEYRKWVDRVGHGMPYYEGYRTSKLVDDTSLVNGVMHVYPTPAAAVAASSAVQGNIGSVHLPNPNNRYWLHVVNCSTCLRALNNFRVLRNVCVCLSVLTGFTALLLGPGKHRATAGLLCGIMIAASYAIQSQAISRFQTAWIRPHKR